MSLRNIILAAAVLSLLSCKNGNEAQPAQEETGAVIITEEQFSSEGMQLGTAVLLNIEDKLACNGVVTTLPNGKAEISLNVPGVIRRIFVRQGQQVHAGQPLMEIGGNELIDLQNDFASAAINYRRLESEFKRADLLFKQNVGSEKEFRVIESDYQNALALYNGLKLKIESVGLSAARAEAGSIVAAYTVTAPIKGVITDLEANIGRYPAQGELLMEILDKDAMQVKLSVFPEDLNGIEAGTPVVFTVPGKEKIKASVISVGSTVDPETKAVECFVGVTENKGNLVNNAFVHAEIIRKNDSVLMMPATALLKTGEGYSVLSFDKKADKKYYFIAKPVKTGRQANGMMEVADTAGWGKVLVKGVYTITAE